MTEHIEQNPRSNNLTLGLIILAFALPIIAAYSYFFFVDDYSLGNHGKLLQPLIKVDNLGLTDVNGEPLSKDELTSEWKMLFFTGKDCESTCQELLFNMRQINVALGKNSNRFKHMIVHQEEMSPQFQQFIQEQHSKALHSYVLPQTLNQAFSASDQKHIPNSIYIMDPLGYIMMRYDHGISPKLILKDLNRLLKISRIG